MENIPNIDPKKMALINEFKKMLKAKAVMKCYRSFLQSQKSQNHLD